MIGSRVSGCRRVRGWRWCGPPCGGVEVVDPGEALGELDHPLVAGGDVGPVRDVQQVVGDQGAAGDLAGAGAAQLLVVLQRRVQVVAVGRGAAARPARRRPRWWCWRPARGAGAWRGRRRRSGPCVLGTTSSAAAATNRPQRMPCGAASIISVTAGCQPWNASSRSSAAASDCHLVPTRPGLGALHDGQEVHVLRVRRRSGSAAGGRRVPSRTGWLRGRAARAGLSMRDDAAESAGAGVDEVVACR